MMYLLTEVSWCSSGGDAVGIFLLQVWTMMYLLAGVSWCRSGGDAVGIFVQQTFGHIVLQGAPQRLHVALWHIHGPQWHDMVNP